MPFFHLKYNVSTYLEITTFAAMIQRGLHTLFVVICIAVITSCGELQRVMRSSDLEYKYNKAVEYYEAEKYNNALMLFDDLLNLYRGTMKAQDVYFYYCKTLYALEDYILAGYHFKTFSETFPSNPNAVESAFMAAKCYYREAPVYSQDQAYTYKAINEIQLFVNRNPGSDKLDECNEMMSELRSKLERKSYEIAYQYYLTKQYQAAVVSFGTTMNEFPDTPYREEALYYRFLSAYELAVNSVEEKKLERFRQARTAYLDFVNAFPDSEYRKDATKVYEKTEEFLNGNLFS